jgi:steroid delta-isomerase-like uncharacterized protein
MVHKTGKHHNSECKHDNSTLMKRWFKEVWNDRRIETIDELLSPNFVGHYEHEEITGSDHWKERLYDVMLKAIPDFRVEVKDVVADRDMVVTRWQAKGVLSEELFGVSPSGEEYEFSGISWTRIVDGTIVENWNNWNMSYLLRQLLSEIKTLRGILPLCSHCKNIRDDKGYWEQVDVYIDQHTEADISHSICPKCASEHYPDLDIYDD